MVSAPQVGDIIRMRAWHGIVLDKFINEQGKTILKVQTVRNIFRRLNPEFIEYDLAPDVIEVATVEQLQDEIANYMAALTQSIEELLSTRNSV
ncbi:MAG: hypothetical protein R3E79_27410 [Caldilineaceae bacterium]